MDWHGIIHGIPSDDWKWKKNSSDIDVILMTFGICVMDSGQAIRKCFTAKSQCIYGIFSNALSAMFSKDAFIYNN